jgi:mono/diheme cytochrome c family protein
MNRIPRILTIALALSASAAFAASASENWESHCAKCHGADGSGNTKIGKKLKLKDYTDAKSLADASDADLQKAILDGVTKDGKEVMKGFKEELSADDAKALVATVRGFKK